MLNTGGEIVGEGRVKAMGVWFRKISQIFSLFRYPLDFLTSLTGTVTSKHKNLSTGMTIL